MRTFLSRIVTFLCLLFFCSCGVGYVVSSSYYQMELLASRKKNKKVLKKGLLSPEKEKNLRLIGEIKQYGKQFGLSATNNYDTIALNWKRTIWNVSACDPLQFKPVTWKFPIVGRVPYLGFFVEKTAKRWKQKLAIKGYDVSMRKVGAYSTLGWFRDPVLPNMLDWQEDWLAEVVLHELAHATLWIRGSVKFNESFANFVGLQASFRYLSEKYGADSKELAKAKQDHRDQRRFEAVLHGLYQDLDQMFSDPFLSEEEKRLQKKELYLSLYDRILASDLEQKERYAASVKRSPWNNARLMQFKTYSSDEEYFFALFLHYKGNLPQFIEAIGKITKKTKDPFLALRTVATPYLALVAEKKASE